MENFEALYTRYYADVYRFALFLTSDTTRAEDLPPIRSSTPGRPWAAFASPL
jgi:hypothetical protein